MNTGLHGKTAIITGASRGIGKAIAFAFANEGVRLMLCARNEAPLTLIESEIRERFHTDVNSMKTNTSRLNDIKRLVNKTVSKFKRIDILVNNAGNLLSGNIFDFDEKIFEEQLHTRLLGTIRLVSEIIPIMKRQGGGKIINIAGTTGIKPIKNFLIHGIINSALINLTKALALELAEIGITVNVINPTYTDTEQTNNIFQSIAEKSNKSLDEIMNNFKSTNPLFRLASVDDIATAAVFLASESANYITGISINVDGGSLIV